MPMTRILVAVLASLLATACGAPPKVVRTYDGDARPPAEIAIVHAKRNGAFVGGIFSGFALNIAAIAVDGNAVPVGNWIWQAPPDIELDPGSHTLTLAVDQGWSTGTIDNPRPTFTAAAGHRYELRGRQVRDSAKYGLSETVRWAWSIVDVTTGTTVAASVASEPPA
jgi:hypothetical protein